MSSKKLELKKKNILDLTCSISSSLYVLYMDKKTLQTLNLSSDINSSSRTLKPDSEFLARFIRFQEKSNESNFDTLKDEEESVQLMLFRRKGENMLQQLAQYYGFHVEIVSQDDIPDGYIEECKIMKKVPSNNFQDKGTFKKQILSYKTSSLPKRSDIATIKFVTNIERSPGADTNNTCKQSIMKSEEESQINNKKSSNLIKNKICCNQSLFKNAIEKIKPQVNQVSPILTAQVNENKSNMCDIMKADNDLQDKKRKMADIIVGGPLGGRLLRKEGLG